MANRHKFTRRVHAQAAHYAPDGRESHDVGGRNDPPGEIGNVASHGGGGRGGRHRLGDIAGRAAVARADRSPRGGADRHPRLPHGDEVQGWDPRAQRVDPHDLYPHSDPPLHWKDAIDRGIANDPKHLQHWSERASRHSEQRDRDAAKVSKGHSVARGDGCTGYLAGEED